MLNYLKWVIFLISSNIYANTAIIDHNNGGDDKKIFSGEWNIYRNALYNNWSFMDYGPQWTYGVQIANVKLLGDQMQNYENDTYINLARRVSFNKISVEIGGQAGYNFGNTPKKLHATSYADITYSISDTLSTHFGGYYVNDELATIHQPFNFQAGIKYKINKFIITGDYYSGNNNLSGAVIDVYYQISKNLRPYIGIMVPETNSGNEFAGITGFTWKIF